MIIFHAAFHDGQLWLWGETRVQIEIAGDQTVRRPSSKARSGRERPSPYDAGGQRLLSALEAVTHGLLMSEDAISSPTIWLPSIGDLPLASSPLIDERPATEAGPSLTPWRVTAIPLTCAEAVELLCACVDREMLAPGIVIGRDLGF